MKCPDCGAEMKPLATSVFCPNDCDRIVEKYIDPEKTEPIRSRPVEFITIDFFLPTQPSSTDPLFGDADLDAWIDSVFDDGTD